MERNGDRLHEPVLVRCQAAHLSAAGQLQVATALEMITAVEVRAVQGRITGGRARDLSWADSPGSVRGAGRGVLGLRQRRWLRLSARS